jgi:hypothetical protein
MRHAGPQPSLPLEQQIRNSERRLAERRRSASAHLATAQRRARAGLTSPGTLLVALGVGVALGQFVSMRRDPVPRAPVRGAGEASGAGVLAMLLDALRIVAPLVAMLSTLDAVRAAVPGAGREQRDQPDWRCPRA